MLPGGHLDFDACHGCLVGLTVFFKLRTFFFPFQSDASTTPGLLGTYAYVLFHLFEIRFQAYDIPPLVINVGYPSDEGGEFWQTLPCHQ